MMKESIGQIQNGNRGSRNWFRVCLIFLFFVCYSALACQQVPLAWDSNVDPNVTGYAVYYGTSSGSHPTRVDAGTNVTATVSNLTEGMTYYFVVTSYNAAAAESAPSKEISYLIPGLLKMSYSASSGAGPMLNFSVAAGQWYEVQATTDMKTWTTISQTAIQSTNMWVQYQDAQTGGAYQSRFYRLVMHSEPPSHPAIASYSVNSSTLRDDVSVEVGFHFIANANLTVYDVGRLVAAGDSGSHQVAIYSDAGNGQAVLVCAGTVSTAGATASTFAYAGGAFASLVAGQSYLILSTETAGGDHWQDDQLTVTPTSSADITVDSSAYIYPVGSGNYILQTPGSHAYGIPNFKLSNP
jgi:Fibronectin type III domain